MLLFRAALALVLLVPSLAGAQDEPGLSRSSPPLPLPASLPAAPQSQPALLARAFALCRPEGCPIFAEVVPLLADAEVAGKVALLLGANGDERAATPLALTAAYGPWAARPLAITALGTLARRAAAAAAVLRMARSDPDPRLRRVARQALTGDPDALLLDAPAPPRPKPPQTVDPDPTRVIYGPTAYRRPRGRWSWTSHDLALWTFDVGITDYLQASLTTVPPIGVLGFFPQLRFGGSISPMVELAVHVGGGVFYPYIENDEQWRVGVYGGGPVLSVGVPRLFFNLGVAGYGIVVADNDRRWTGIGDVYAESTDYRSAWLIIPSLGVSGQVSARVKLNLEAHVPLGDHGLNGKIWVILYGVRIFARNIYGDVSFVIPAYPGAWDILKYIPIGLPLLSFGVQW